MSVVTGGEPLSEAAQAELLELCEEQYTHLEQLHNDIILCEPDDGPHELSVNRLILTEAELRQWQTAEPTLLAENSELLLQAGKEEMRKLRSQLELVVSNYEVKRHQLRETKELELKWLEEKKQVLQAATDHAQRLKMDKDKLPIQGVLQETKAKIQKMKEYQEGLMECLGDVLERHAPLPQDESNANRKKKNAQVEMNHDLISLNEILEMLMNKALSSPHDPYVQMDDTFWPPYIEMLLRYGVAVRHQENSVKIRLENFF